LDSLFDWLDDMVGHGMNTDTHKVALWGHFELDVAPVGILDYS